MKKNDVVMICNKLSPSQTLFIMRGISLLLISFLWIGCSKNDRTLISKQVVIDSNTFGELSSLIETKFNGDINDLLQFEGAIINSEDSVEIFYDSHSFRIFGSHTFVEYVETLLEAYQHGRLEDLRREIQEPYSKGTFDRLGIGE